MSIYKMYTATDGDGAASLDIIAPGTITGMFFSGWSSISADGESFEAEVSFASTSGFATNDTKSSIAGVSKETQLVTSGQTVGEFNTMVGPIKVPVAQGERLYLHTATPTGSQALRMRVWIYVEDHVRSPRRVRQ